MTDDFQPVYEPPTPDPLPFDEDGDAFVQPEAAETFLNADGEFVLEEARPIEAIDPPVPFWTRLRRALFGGADVSRALRHLDEAIENAPDAPANYVLRGELYLRAREYALAQRDFQRAYELATGQFERSDWGILAQAMQDRALAGLQKAERRLGNDVN